MNLLSVQNMENWHKNSNDLLVHKMFSILVYSFFHAVNFSFFYFNFINHIIETFLTANSLHTFRENEYRLYKFLFENGKAKY